MLYGRVALIPKFTVFLNISLQELQQFYDNLYMLGFKFKILLMQ